MSACDPVLELARQWWTRAVEDLEVARAARHIPTACCFHCQQAVEKGLKAILVLNQIEFEKTHDIGRLLTLQAESAPSIPQEIADCLVPLTRFAVETRYPPASASVREARAALEVAERFIEWARTIPQNAGPLRIPFKDGLH